MEDQYTHGQLRQFLSLLIIVLLFVFISSLYADTNLIGEDFAFDSIFDEYIDAKMQEQGIPGAVIVIVRDGRIFFSRGYGYANLEDRIPVDPSKTLFRVGSISKVITGTAVMQCIERGLIDPYADVNDYLTTFKIPQTYKEPVTTAHLLTHTAGFDDRYIGKSARTPDDRISLAEYCEKYLPQRFIPPGEMYTYSNYGNALAGYLVEIVSGTPFADYVDAEIVKPLGMNYSGFELTDELAPYLAYGYSDFSGEFRPLPFDYLLDAPAGQFVSSGDDIARFMLAHLNGGVLNGNRILTEHAIREMHRKQFTNHHALDGGVAYTFDVRTMNGHRTLSHGGAYAGFFALMTIFPEENTGVFIAHNILKTNFINGVLQSIIDRLFDNANAVTADLSITIPVQLDADIKRFVGTYRHTRYPRNTYDKIGVLTGAMGGEMRLQKNNDGMLLMPDIFGNLRRLVQTDPLVFQSVDDNYTLAFREDKTGRITHAFTSGVNSMERVPWYYTVKLHRVLAIFFPFFFITTAGIAFMMYIIRKLRSPVNSSTDRSATKLKRIHILISVTFIMYILISIIVIGTLVSIEEILGGFPYGLPNAMYVVQLMPFGIIFLVIGLLYFVVREWYEKKTTPLKRLYYSGYFFVSAAAILFLGYWNLIGFYF